MIHIKETFPNDHSVAVLVGGTLDLESVDLLEKLCQNHLNEGRDVSLHLKDVLHVSREGVKFLQQIRKRVALVDLPKFIR